MADQGFDFNAPYSATPTTPAAASSSASGFDFNAPYSATPPATAAATPLSQKPIPTQPAPAQARQEFLRRTGGGATTEEGISAANKTAAGTAAGLVASEAAGPVVGKVLGPTLGHVMEFLGLGNEAAEVAAKPAAQEMQKVASGVYDQYGKQIFRDVPVEAKQAAAKVIQHPLVRQVLKKVIRKLILDSAGTFGGYEAGKAVAGEPGAVVGGAVGSTATHVLSDSALRWLLSENTAGESPAGENPAVSKKSPAARAVGALPDVQEGKVRFTSSDGGIHDVPHDQIEAARRIDPQLQVHET
jgi:hypothetical protein